MKLTDIGLGAPFTRRAEAEPCSPITRLPAYAWIIGLVVAAIYLSTILHLPVAIIGGAAHDDSWFYERARKIIDGAWLGHYSQMTLMKGPGYAFFLAFNFIVGGSAILSEGLLYIAACTVFCRAVFRLGGPAPVALGLFTLLLWHPLMFPFSTIRDNIYTAQILLYLACLAQTLFLPAPSRIRMVWTVTGGLMLAWCWMTREEGVWLIPASLVIVTVGLWLRRARLRYALVFAGSALAACLAVCTINFAAYRTFEIVDFKDHDFSNALRAVQNVRVGDPLPFTPAPRAVRQALYRESPAFARLRPYLEGPGGQAWLNVFCGRGEQCDFPVSLFMWAFRDAVAYAGEYRSAAAAKAYYRRLEAEIDQACQTGRLTCTKGLIAYLPPVTPSQLAKAPSELRRMLLILLGQERRPVQPPSFDTNRAHEQRMWEFEGLPRRTVSMGDPDAQLLAGWYHAPAPMWLEAVCNMDGKITVIPFEHVRSLDISIHFKDPSAIDRRFRMQLPDQADCSLRATGSPDTAPALRVGDLINSKPIRLAGEELYLDVGGVQALQQQSPVLATLMGVYSKLLPILLAAAGVAWVVHLVQAIRRSPSLDAYWWWTHAMWALLACRIAVLLAVDITSFTTQVPTYLFPAHALFCVAMVMTIGLPFRRRTVPLAQAVKA